MEYSEIIKKIRTEKGYSQEELAKELGVSFTSVNRWETKKSEPRNGALNVLQESFPEYFIRKVFPQKHKKLNAIALFAGAGGFHIGMEKAGFNILMASDIEPAAELTHKKNWPKLPFLCKDIREVSTQEILNLTDNKKPDIIFGGPPCQGFSTIGAKMSSDPRNELFDHYARIVGDLKPRYFLFENVKALTTMYGGQFKDKIIRKFSKLGYTCYETILNTANFGVPQFRERVFIFGTLSDSPFMFPNPTHGKDLLPYETVGKHIMDLADIENESLNGHSILNHSETVIKRYELIPEGGKLPPPEELPEEIRRNNFGNTYKRLDRNAPSLTMVPGNNAFPIHPTKHRSLTPREAARLQTFPDNHNFIGDRRRQCILVGNAVPPKLAEIIGKSILEHHFGNVKKQDSSKPTVLITDSENSIENSIIPMKSLSKLNESKGFVDLFCGAGGFTIGFAKAGWKPLLGVDINKSVTITHTDNFPSIPFLNGDLSDENVFNITTQRFENKEVGIVVGGPPCQGFSIFGKRRFVNTQGYNPHDDPRNKLVYSYLNVVKKIQPRWFLMENVPGLANLDQGLFLQSLIEEFKEIGYKNTEFRILNAAEYGVPQLRRRLIIIGNRTGHIIPWPKKKYFEKPKEWQKKFRTVGEVISDLSEEKSLSEFTCHVPMNHKPLLVERYKYIEEGEKLNVDKLPEHLKSGYRTDKVKNYSHVFKRLHRDKPSTTMVPGHNAFPIHPWLNRSLTVREAARIQTFPDEIHFKGNRQEQCIQVGNAFPPLLAQVLGENILKAEQNNWFPGSVPDSAYYALINKEEDNNQLELILQEDES